MDDYRKFLKEVLIPADVLQKRIAELGAEISRDFQGQELLLICILRGGVMFMTDLMRFIDVPVAIDFMAISSYGTGQRESTGQVRITLDLTTNIDGRNILIVEDIVDSGRTLQSVLNLLTTRKPRSLQVCTLLDKADRREVEVPIRYCGFTIPNKFVFGYGLDLDEFYRNLPFIGVVDLDKYPLAK
ncbi:MAG: hypoxanthine phosphoribosyltransferase [Anaerolineaceae bacterium]|nr:hypoxanthine phosphoribosyltransferase [Anaerolineaceae bacterium]MBN2677919.1 hypoxanthine phosphoribosyltransferase [Anaerolineaceae bacterium]